MKYTEHAHVTSLLKDKLSFWLLQNIKGICQNYLQHNTHTMFGNYWQVYTSKCYPGSCSWATSPEKTATAFKNTALDILRRMFHLLREGKGNRNCIYFPISNYCTKGSECNMSVKSKEGNWLKTNSISILSIAKAAPQPSSRVHTSSFGSTGYSTTTCTKDIRKNVPVTFKTNRWHFKGRKASVHITLQMLWKVHYILQLNSQA